MQKSYPIFIKLQNKSVLVVGGGVVAERKIQSLLASGANVYLVSQTVTKTIQSWIDEKRVIWMAKEFNPQHLDEVYLVIAATNDSELNQMIFLEAEKKYKLVNVVDNPELCNFTLPAILDRTPVQIAIGTEGTSPVLSRHLRNQLELQIPQHIGDIAQIAGEYRQLVKRKLQDSQLIREFWERLLSSEFDLLVRNQSLEEAEQYLQTALEQPQKQTGKVFLVGAGPGDSGLLTLKAFEAIQCADVLLHDALISEEILNLVRKDAEKIYVGKRAGNHHVVQKNINELLVEYAKQGKKVVRLKGGDPFVFGRGGEELQVLIENNIPYQVIPGITAAIGATAYAGVPLTHRDYAQTVIFITGHLANTQQDLNWGLLADSHQTLAVYMGTLQAKHIAEKLISHGRSKTTPVAIISRGTLSNQIVVTGQLSELEDLAQQAVSPSIMLIGETVELHNQLNWFGK
ncbi:uroporphyrinogen-III C-methyltransferase [Neisseriaceae bacterium PsAf]|nr:uroporphyrinogen-III C-methyltransferase [Neisseriaceae bacterium PsAf]